MHGVWALVFVPAAAVVAWRCCGPKLKRLSFLMACLCAVGLVGWFGAVAIQGTDLVQSVNDRVFHAMGVIISSISIPLVQLLLAFLLVVIWPERWRFKKTQPEPDR